MKRIGIVGAIGLAAMMSLAGARAARESAIEAAFLIATGEVASASTDRELVFEKTYAASAAGSETRLRHRMTRPSTCVFELRSIVFDAKGGGTAVLRAEFARFDFSKLRKRENFNGLVALSGEAGLICRATSSGRADPASLLERPEPLECADDMELLDIATGKIHAADAAEKALDLLKSEGCP